MNISETAEEILEALWILNEDNKKSVKVNELNGKNNKGILELMKQKLITLIDQEVTLTDNGTKEASNSVRRHRLAERLLVDILVIKKQLVEDVACKLEHLLQRGVEENVCELLGHPKLCPHGKPIPSGKCCQNARKDTKKAISALSDMKPGQKGTLSYISTRESDFLRKYLAMGILPGTQINLIQNFPTYVFKIDHTQIAIDEDLAKSIYVRLEKIN